MEAGEIFLRLLRGDTLHSDDVKDTVLTKEHFRNEEDWTNLLETAGGEVEAISFERRYEFEEISIVPTQFPKEQLELVAGTHDPHAQVFFNQILPVKVFNLSITSPDVIEATHQRMRDCFHQDGGEWERRDMPRTTFVFLNAESDLDEEQQNLAAQKEAELALGAYWRALDGTLDPDKVKKAANNALIGNPREVAKQALERFHPEDRIMTWFDFFNHDSARVMRNMEAWMTQVVPLIEKGLERIS